LQQFNNLSNILGGQEMKNLQLFIQIALILMFPFCLFAQNIRIQQGNKAVTDQYVSQQKETNINFEGQQEGTVPKGFTMSSTGKAISLDWKIVNENANNVVFQSAKNPDAIFNLLVYQEKSFQDLTMSVKIKAVAGEEDQGGGLVWRYIDNNNYYIARYNPLETNLRLYKVVNGSREKLRSIDFNIKTGEWFTMTIEMKGNKVICSLNNNKLIEETDETFKNAGKIGFWTKADAQSYFDDLTIK
jgi:hypothetical protein